MALSVPQVKDDTLSGSRKSDRPKSDETAYAGDFRCPDLRAHHPPTVVITR